MRHVFGPVFTSGWGLIVPNLILVVIVAAAVVGGVLLVRSAAARQQPPWPGHPAPPWQSGGHQALAELDLRYARGEVDRDDYLQRRADLLGMVAPGSPGSQPGAAQGDAATGPKSP